MDRQAFKQRMQNLKSYREQNPGKGYWDFKDDRTDHPVERPVYYEPTERTIGPADRVDAPEGTKYSELTDKQKLQLMQSDALNNDKPLESIHPEFDLILGARMLFNAPTKIDKLLRELKNTPTKEALAKQSNTKLFKDLTTFGKDDSRYVHTQLGKANSVFSGTKRGAYIKDNKLYPGESRIYDQEPYIWWNKNKAYSELGADEDGFTATIIKDTDADDLTQVRKMTKPVGQWNGRSGFVQKSEYVTQKPVSLKDAEQFRYNGLTKTYERVKYYTEGGETGDDEPIRTGTTQYDAYGNTTYYLPVSLSNDTLNIGLPDISVTVRDNLNLAAAVQAGQDQIAGIGREVFANLTPYGDIESAVYAYDAAKNKDWLGLSLAGLGMLPLIPSGVRKTSHAVQKLRGNKFDSKLMQDRIAQQFAEYERRRAKQLEYITNAQQDKDAVYDTWVENEDAFRRAVEFDKTHGTNYKDAYGDALKERSLEFGMRDLPLNVEGSFDPATPDYIFLNTNHSILGKPSAGTVNHEMGHAIDYRAGVFDETGNTKIRLFNPKKFKSRSELKEIYENEKDLDDIFNYRLKDSEIKSHMNHFRTYLRENDMLNPSGKESLEDFKKKLFDSNFEGLKKIFNSYKNPKTFIKDFNSIPITKAKDKGDRELA